MGNALFKCVVEATGLPQDTCESEFKEVLSKYGKNPETLTLEELREVIAEFLQDSLLELSEH
ncbi:MAG: hypothetical protein ACLGGX_01880 [Bdellovibrionia bacterium]